MCQNNREVAQITFIYIFFDVAIKDSGSHTLWVCLILLPWEKHFTVVAHISDHLRNLKKWLQLELVTYENKLSYKRPITKTIEAGHLPEIFFQAQLVKVSVTHVLRLKPFKCVFR